MNASRRSGAIARLRGLVLCGCLLALTVEGEPHVPSEDSTILERLPAMPATRALAPLRAALEKNPQDLERTLQLARGYLEIGRTTADPRFVSYAQATLAPWMQQANPPAAVLVLQATALQSSHRFGEALALLDGALAMEPRNAQAWLTKATLLQVQGGFADARTACRQLLHLADHWIALTCIASVDSLTGRLQASYQALQQHFSVAGNEGGQRSWMSGELAEMALRLGDFAAAEQHFTAALKDDPDDVYLRAAYADLLLMQDRDPEVIQMLRESPSQDVLLLRIAIAARRAGSGDAETWARQFEARRRATRSDDNPHLREHARFLLDVLGRNNEALALARQNWKVQREPADVRLYLRAAQNAESVEDERIVREWIRETGYEDRTLPASAIRP